HSFRANPKSACRRRNSRLCREALRSPPARAFPNALSRRNPDKTNLQPANADCYAVPSPVSTPVFGKFEAGQLRTQSEDNLKNTFSRPSRATAPGRAGLELRPDARAFLE